MANPIPTAFKPQRPAEHEALNSPPDLIRELTLSDDSDTAADDDGDSGGDAGTKGTGSAG
jgi:hypothetical protein